MAIYKVILKTTVPNGPLLETVERTFHIEGGGDYLDDMFRKAKAHNWECTAIPVHTRTIESVIEAFGVSVTNAV